MFRSWQTWPATSQFIVLCWAAFVLYWIVMAGRVKRTVERSGAWTRFVIGVAMVVVLFTWGRLRRHGMIRVPEYWWGYSLAAGLLGALLTVLGLALAIWARNVIGRNWSATVVFKENHELIERGPYAYVRHPIYSALLLMILGTAVASGAPEWFVILGVAFVMLLVKARMEERMMTRHFPAAYPAYKRRVKALIPFVL
jgi:protein-S-isoprenylcysteine O-methyltransferase Ste14